MSDNQTYLFNTILAQSRGISEVDQQAMQRIYEHLHKILARPSMYCVSPVEAVEVIQGLEYTLQLFWKFPVDKRFHSYWMEIKGCTCPKMDNRERAGTSYKIITCDCPYHGEDKAETWEDRGFE